MLARCRVDPDSERSREQFDELFEQYGREPDEVVRRALLELVVEEMRAEDTVPTWPAIDRAIRRARRQVGGARSADARAKEEAAWSGVTIPPDVLMRAVRRGMDLPETATDLDRCRAMDAELVAAGLEAQFERHFEEDGE